MITVGPFTLVANTPQTLQDPFAGTGGAAAGIQIQNLSGFVLTVTGFGSPVTVQAIAAQTIALPTSGASVTIDPASSASQGPSSVFYAVWLLPGEKSDTPDGPLTTASIDITGGTVTAVFQTGATVDIGNTPSVTVASGTVNVGNTPSVVVDTSGGAVPVNASGTVVVSSITSPVTATVSNTVTVSPSGTFNIQGVTGGTTVGITGSVSISNTPAVTINSGTVTATITSGTVNIGNTPAVTIDTTGGAVAVNATGTVAVSSITSPVTVGSITNAVTVTPSGTINVQGVSGGTAIGIAGTVNIGNTPAVTVNSGTVDATITSGTVAISSAPALDINNVSGGTINIDTIAQGNAIGANAVENIEVAPPAAPTVTVTGAASTTYHYTGWFEVPNVGMTTGSLVTTISNGPTTLSGSAYNTVALVPVVPAGYVGNLVYDSNLANATAATGATWTTFGTSIGTSNGDVNVANPGTDSAAWYIIGTGSALGDVGVGTPVGVECSPGDVFTLSWINADISQVTSGTFSWIISSTNSYLADVMTTPISSPSGSRTFTVPAGKYALFVQTDANNSTVAAGQKAYWGIASLTKTSTVQPYTPGPLWICHFARGGYEIGSGSALAINDTGLAQGVSQAPAFNTSGTKLQVVSSEIDSVLAPMTRMLVPNSGGNTFWPGSAASAADMTTVALDPPDALNFAAVNTWYRILGLSANPIASPLLIRQIEINCVVAAGTVYIGLVRANGSTQYIGTYFMSQYEFVFEQIPIEIYPGDFIVALCGATGALFYIRFWCVDL